MRVYNEPIYNAALDATGGAQTAYSKTLDLRHAAGYSIHSIVTKVGGVVAGTVITQKSNDEENWIDDVTTNLIDGNLTTPLEKPDLFYAFARVKITLTTGQASFYLPACTKGF